MRRILFRWHGIDFYSYPSMLYVGLVAGIAAGNVAAHASGADALRVWCASIVLVFAAIFGSRLLFVITHWREYWPDTRRLWNRKEGGMAQYGGFVLAVALSLPLLAMLHIPTGVFWDIGAVTILVGMIPTRVGCLLNGCCAGRPSNARFALRLPNYEGVWRRRIPSQLLELALAVLLLALCILLWGRAPFPGAIFLLSIVGYASGRLLLQSLRERRGNGRFTVHHAISLVLIFLGLATLAIAWP